LPLIGLIVGHLILTAGFDDEQASLVVDAVYLSRSRDALRKAWVVLVAVCADDEDEDELRRTGGRPSPGSQMKDSQQTRKQKREAKGELKKETNDVLDRDMKLSEFARLLPLLGDDLPLSRVERLFEEVH
jgi:hypothetical protein